MLAWLTRRSRVLLVRRPPEGLLGGLWELPGDELAKNEPLGAGLSRAVQERVGLEVAGARRVGEVRHVFTHRVLKLHVFRARVESGRVRRAVFDAHRWVSPSAVNELPLSAVAKKALAVANDG